MDTSQSIHRFRSNAGRIPQATSSQQERVLGTPDILIHSGKSLPDRRLVPLSGLLVALLISSTLTCCSDRKSAFDQETTAWNGKLCRELDTLKDLDVGDVESARRRLAEDCLQIVSGITKEIGSLDRDALYKQASLRSAAKYWKDKRLPANLEVFNRSDPAASNRIFQALAVVGAQLDMKANAPALRFWERSLPRNDIDKDKLRLDLGLLTELDAGDTNSVRAKLGENCLGCVLWIVRRAGSSTNADLLCAQPGLRAAADYWATNSFPSHTAVLALEEFSNSVCQGIKRRPSASRKEASRALE